LFVHGAQDDIVPIEYMESAKNTLEHAGFDVKIVVGDASHGIDGYMIVHTMKFLQSL